MQIDEKIRRFSMKWIAFDEIHYTDNKGKKRIWESCARTGAGGAVCIAAELVPSGRILLVRQFRPPAGKLMLELPAGLVDPGEDPAVTAIRELREETGYVGELRYISDEAYSSCGLTPETIRMAFMTVDETCQTDRKTDFDDSEDIETFAVPIDQLEEFIQEQRNAGVGIDAKLMVWVAFRQYLP